VCRAADSPAELAAVAALRHEVFVTEQGLFAGNDRDEHDTSPEVIHLVGLIDGAVCGTVRLYRRTPETGLWKGDRLAVRRGYRHLGLGGPLVRQAVATAARYGGRQMLAMIQPDNVAFFERLGWRRTGALEEYVGVPHQRMLIDLPGKPASAPPGSTSPLEGQAGSSPTRE
jgi:putative N-acetyltransferase (TIGR04045 family)